MIELKTPEAFRREFVMRHKALAKAKAYYTHVARQCPDDDLWNQYMLDELEEDDPQHQAIKEWVELRDRAQETLEFDLRRRSELDESVFHSGLDLSQTEKIKHEEMARINKEVAQLDPSDL